MRQVEDLKGKRVATDLSFKDGQLDYKATATPDTVYLPAKDSLVYVPQPVEVEVNRLSWWQETWIRIGQTLSALVAAAVLWKVIRKRLKH